MSHQQQHCRWHMSAGGSRSHQTPTGTQQPYQFSRQQSQRFVSHHQEQCRWRMSAGRSRSHHARTTGTLQPQFSRQRSQRFASHHQQCRWRMSAGLSRGHQSPAGTQQQQHACCSGFMSSRMRRISLERQCYGFTTSVHNHITPQPLLCPHTHLCPWQ